MELGRPRGKGYKRTKTVGAQTRPTSGTLIVLKKHRWETQEGFEDLPLRRRVLKIFPKRKDDT